MVLGIRLHQMEWFYGKLKKKMDGCIIMPNYSSQLLMEENANLKKKFSSYEHKWM